jgi:hypothetical protein
VLGDARADFGKRLDESEEDVANADACVDGRVTNVSGLIAPVNEQGTDRFHLESTLATLVNAAIDLVARGVIVEHDAYTRAASRLAKGESVATCVTARFI